MKEYILNLEFENWFNQIWFMNSNTKENDEKWKKCIEEIEKIKFKSEDAMIFQEKVIEYLKKQGFIRVQK